MAMEVLSRLLADYRELNTFHGIKISRGSPKITHLLFADDIFLFCHATTDDILTLKAVFDLFSDLSGQEINLSKSSIHFSRNVPSDLRRTLCTLIGIKEMSSESRYLGHKQEAFSASLQAFKSEISTYLIQFSNLYSKPRSEILTLSWVQQCLQLLPSMNRAFKKLMVDINYPMNRWQVPLVDDYLKESLKLLELLNSITSSLSHLGQARMSLSYALSLLENSPSLAMKTLEAIQPLGSNKKWEGEETKARQEVVRYSSGEEWVICQAMAIMKVVGFWICGVVASSLCGDIESCLKLRKLIEELPNSSLMSLHVSVCEEMMKKGGLFEVKEVNKGVVQLGAVTCGGSSSDEAEELRRRVEILGKLLKDVGNEVNQLFSEVLLERNNLLNSLHQKQ
ncbi:protein BPS1, chloroplastic-like [Telopea speciosissima]|uniref:protein BPS1, chloroplastic-like n=1 Tax=Telopea speciosissima TaxID=54955 RepID=UPI001CC5CAFF|nr:protein BPS1, chloroplastic-like [Telopea speciosissima]